MSRIVCIGNRLVRGDDAGPRVHTLLSTMDRPPEVELIDGGLAGLDLLRFLDGGGQVVFVDAIHGYGQPDEVIVLDGETIAGEAHGAWDHAAGLPHVLHVAPAVCDPPLAQVKVVGIELPASDHAVERAAAIALSLAGAPHEPAGRTP